MNICVFAQRSFGDRVPNYVQINRKNVINTPDIIFNDQQALKINTFLVICDKLSLITYKTELEKMKRSISINLILTYIITKYLFLLKLDQLKTCKKVKETNWKL